MTPLFTEHPMLPQPTAEEIDAIVARHGDRAGEVLREVEHHRRFLVERAKVEPYDHGWELPCWKDADELLRRGDTQLLANLGGNGSSKTTWAIKKIVKTAFTVPKARCLVLHEDATASIDVHQRMAYEFLPRQYKPVPGYKPKKGIELDITYSVKNGFATGAFTTPGGGIVRFGGYNQDIERLEGGGWTLIFADENMPLSWLDTLMYRLGRAGGKMIWCFTAIRGITPAIASLIQGARTLRSLPVDPDILPTDHRVSDDQDWPVGEMPYIQQCVRPEAKVIFFHSSQNMLGGYDPERGRGPGHDYRNLVTLLKNRPLVERERRAYGWTRKGARTVFPSFGVAHVVQDDVLRERLKILPITRYHIIDPAGARNFFMLWFAVDAHGRHFIYREWPDVPSHGEWALPSDTPEKWDGKAGPAQESCGYGVKQYKRLILEAEGGKWKDGAWEMLAAEDIFDRYIDPRSGATEAMAADAGESSLIDRFAEEQSDEQGAVTGPSMYLEPAISGKSEDDGLTQINELLEYNATEPVTALVNEPHLFVSDACENTIWAMQNYTSHDGAKAACKDPIDCVRYMALKKCVHVAQPKLAGVSGGGWR
jgi:hypothetical protein